MPLSMDSSRSLQGMQQQAKAGAFVGSGHESSLWVVVLHCTLSSAHCPQHPSIVNSATAAFHAELIIS